MASTRIHVQLGLVESIWLILGYMYTRTSREYMANTRIYVQLGLVETIWLILGYMYN